MELVKTSAQEGSFTQSVMAGPYELTSDVSPNEGGGGLGPAPHDFLSVALATCTSMTLQMYAKRKEWPLKAIDVEVNFEKNKDGSVTFFKKINMQGELDQEQIQKLIEISDKCPVYKMLSGSINIKLKN